MQHPDLARERSHATKAGLDTESLTSWLDGGHQHSSRRRHLRNLVERDPTFSNKGNAYLSRPQRYAKGLKKAAALAVLKRRVALSEEDKEYLDDAVVEGLPTMLHDLMFIPNIKALCTDEQQAKWLPRCETMEVVGCYAQTELGHGSNVRGLETTATYIAESDEFEIDSPTLTATKWWPGTLGRTANHCMLIAQLIIDGKCHGLHNFLVQLRDMETHLPLAGVSVGDIGPKLGFNSMDNGYARFNRLRIPRENMAMRYSRVDRGGQYVSLHNKKAGATAKISYLTMVQVRAYIVRKAGYTLAKASTIAVRYSAVRRQGFSASGGERQVLDYTMQLRQLLPCVATAYAFHFTGRMMAFELKSLESDLMAALGQSSPSLDMRLAEFHASSSGLKSLCSMVTATGIEDCRQACGGHGYLQSSGLPEVLGTYLQTVTVEGENRYLPQQTAKYLLKALRAGAMGKSTEGCQYLVEGKKWKCAASSPSDLRESQELLNAFESRAAHLVQELAQSLDSGRSNGLSAEAAWNDSLVHAFRASKAHSWVLIYRSFSQAVLQSRAELPTATGRILESLLALFGLYWMEEDMGDFLGTGCLSTTQARWVRDQVVQLLHELRNCAVVLVDAWDFSDGQLLDSVLGRKDGLVYEALMREAKLSPLNHEEPGRGVLEYLRPVSSRL